MKTLTSGLVRIGSGVIAGAGVATVDNLAFGGEVSPIVIVGMLVIIAGAAGMVWGIRAASVAVIAWAWLPAAHVVKRWFGLPDTLHPNTYASILMLGIFSFLITAIGLGFGLAFRRLFRASPVEP